MKKNYLKLLTVGIVASCLFIACNTGGGEQPATGGGGSAGIDAKGTGGGQSTVQDDVSQKNIVQTAIGSPDHTTLVAAVKAAELVDALSNAGPFTVFAPTNAAFDKLPKGTVEGLLKPEKKADLQNILQYHVAVAVLKKESFTDGQVLGMVNGDNATIAVKDGNVTINGANIVASIPTSNGIIHVIDAVLLPPAPK
ncbi:fasciclin domain-containing protein [Sphingobacteriales bacterium UPWRP_1]|nr:fasciclin [Sphingobacteriales bacterium TSM_CSS]PSJ75092.1 fasciclin domain-containing protein [Sphingobacteriales bacterium UPWRP_1]